MANFSKIAAQYEKDSLVQKTASEILFDLLAIQPEDTVLDIGCGTGHITKVIGEKTTGRVVGIDPSAGMIAQAAEKYGGENISFRMCPVEQLDYEDEFDIIFCNSAFQWFVDPDKALSVSYHALKHKGKMAIQAPATVNYCPNFLEAMGEVENHQATRDIFASFASPWFFRGTAREYAALFERAGFIVEKSTIDAVATSHTAEEVYKIFESGAAAGYLNQQYYGTELSQQYIDTFRDIVRSAFAKQADENGQVRLHFYRIYLLGVKV